MPKPGRYVQTTAFERSEGGRRGAMPLPSVRSGPIGPFHPHSGVSKMGTLTKEGAAEAAETAHSLIGNTSMAKKNISEMNAELVEMVTEDEVFLDSAPELFEKTFASNAKQRADELRYLKQVQHKPFLALTNIDGAATTVCHSTREAGTMATRDHTPTGD